MSLKLIKFRCVKSTNDIAIKYSFDYIYKGSNTPAEDARESNDLVVLANADIMFDNFLTFETF